jgi:hypothetical protein
LLPVLATALVVLGISAATAHGATVTYSASVALQSTDWSATLTIPQFDPALGTLTSVTVEVRDSLVHKVEFENQSPSSTSRFRDSVYVTVDVLRPASTSLVTAISKIYQTSLVGTYDGTLDYAGTSGITVDGLVNYTINSSTTTASSDLALFTGTGTIGLPCQAVAYFLFSYNGGNASYRLTTQAQALVLVTYTYDHGVVPTHPTSWGRIKSLYR